jgi:hypothetical protein
MVEHDDPRGKENRTSIPAQIRDNQATPIIGHKVRTATPRWWVKTRSKIGEVTIAARIPDRSIAAPI